MAGEGRVTRCHASGWVPGVTSAGSTIARTPVGKGKDLPAFAHGRCAATTRTIPMLATFALDGLPNIGWLTRRSARTDAATRALARRRRGLTHDCPGSGAEAGFCRRPAPAQSPKRPGGTDDREDAGELHR